MGLLALWPVDDVASAALRAGAQAPAAGTPVAPDFAVWLKGLAPANPLKAATEDQILPLVVFACLHRLRADPAAGRPGRVLVDAIQALGEAMIVIVRWVLMAAPIGVFCLGLGVGLRAGAGPRRDRPLRRHRRLGRRGDHPLRLPDGHDRGPRAAGALGAGDRPGAGRRLRHPVRRWPACRR
jgi:hypothetical protein